MSNFDSYAPYIFKAGCIARTVPANAVVRRVKKRQLVLTRHLIMHLLHKFLGWGPVKIQKFLLSEYQLKLDHSTIIYGLNLHKDLYQFDKAYHKEVDYAYQLCARALYEPGFTRLIGEYADYLETSYDGLSFDEYNHHENNMVMNETISIRAQVDAYVEVIAEQMQVTKELIYSIITHQVPQQ